MKKFVLCTMFLVFFLGCASLFSLNEAKADAL